MSDLSQLFPLIQTLVPNDLKISSQDLLLGNHFSKILKQLIESISECFPECKKTSLLINDMTSMTCQEVIDKWNADYGHIQDTVTSESMNHLWDVDGSFFSNIDLKGKCDDPEFAESMSELYRYITRLILISKIDIVVTRETQDKIYLYFNSVLLALENNDMKRIEDSVESLSNDLTDKQKNDLEVAIPFFTKLLININPQMKPLLDTLLSTNLIKN